MTKSVAINTVFNIADELLMQIGKASDDLEISFNAMQSEILCVQNKYKTMIEPLEKKVEALDKSIRKHAKSMKKALFIDKDRVDLPHGSLIHQLEMRVKRAQGVLQNLKTAGLNDGIKIAESVDWAKLEKWPDEWLKKAGTERVQKEEFSYEVKK